MKEEQMSHGAIPIHPIRRFVHRKLNRKKLPKTVGAIGFDWNTGYDVRDTIGSIAIKNQGANDSCGGQAGSYFIEIQRRLQGIKEGALSAKSIYSPIAYPSGGTTVNQLEWQVATKGANLETVVSSYDINGNPLAEVFMQSKAWETPQLMADALTRAGYTAFDVPTDIESVASVISQYGACLWEITGQNNGTWTSPMPAPPSKLNPNGTWNHFMCAIGAKMINGKKYIVSLQSEGQSWGDNGIQYISEDYFTSGYMVDCFTFIYDEHLVPNSDNTSLEANLVRWFRMFFASLSLKYN